MGVFNRLKDLTGQKFGRLTVLHRAKNDKFGSARWHCSCECGNENVVNGTRLIRGIIRSCGCLRDGHPTHGHSRVGNRSSEYNTWASMLARCRNPNVAGYENYGGRGITVCDRWQYGEDGKSGFECFLADMGAKPSPKHEIDRWPDKNGNYEPGNCRWATDEEQANNTRRNRWIEILGRLQTITQWAHETGLNESVIRQRRNRGWPPERLLEPVSTKRREAAQARRRCEPITVNGRTQTRAEWARETGLSVSTLQMRQKRKWPLDRLLSPISSKRRPKKTAAVAALLDASAEDGGDHG